MTLVHAGFWEAVNFGYQATEPETELGERHFVAPLLSYFLPVGFITAVSCGMTSHLAE